MGHTTAARIRTNRTAQGIVGTVVVVLLALTTTTAALAVSSTSGSGGQADGGQADGGQAGGQADGGQAGGPTGGGGGIAPAGSTPPPSSAPASNSPSTISPSTTSPSTGEPVDGSGVTSALPRLDTPVVAGTPTLALDDVAYGPLPDQVLDVYETPGGQPTGAIVYVHGGAWIGGDEDLTSSPFPQLIRDLAANERWTVFSVRYRLAADPSIPGDTGTPFPAALLDVNRAVRWVKANADEFSIDPDRVVVYGWSAGGHLATMLGTTWNEPALQPADLPTTLASVSPRPAAVVSLAAPLDPRAWGDSNPDPSNLYSPGAAIASFAGCAEPTYASCTTDDVGRLDVTVGADPADPPLYLGHGDQDGIVAPLPQQAAVMRLAAAIGPDRVTYDLTSVGSPDDRNHVPDMGLDGAALRAFLDANG